MLIVLRVGCFVLACVGSGWNAANKQWLQLGCCLLATALVFSSCRGPSGNMAKSGSAVFVVEVAAVERFRIEVGAEHVAQAEALLKSGERACVLGEVVPGNGGINAPYNWHLRHVSIQFAKNRTASADALPGEVEEDLDKWLRDIVTYSPWASRIIARER